MAANAKRGGPSSTKYGPETIERVVRLVLETAPQYRHEWQAIKAIAGKFEIHPETVKRWVHAHRVALGEVPASLDERDVEIAQLRRENAELTQTVEILKAAASFFARECDPRPPLSAGSLLSTETGSESHRSAES